MEGLDNGLWAGPTNSSNCAFLMLTTTVLHLISSMIPFLSPLAKTGLIASSYGHNYESIAFPVHTDITCTRVSFFFFRLRSSRSLILMLLTQARETLRSFMCVFITRASEISRSFTRAIWPRARPHSLSLIGTPSPTGPLWPPNSELKVSFINVLPAIEFEGDNLTKKQLIDWMNEWSIPGSGVPRFVLTVQHEESDIRVEFTSTGRY